MKRLSFIALLVCLQVLGASGRLSAQEPAQAPVQAPVQATVEEPTQQSSQEPEAVLAPMPAGDAQRGRLVFGPCRTCHYPEALMGHNTGPNLHRIFGKVAGKQAGFDYYSEDFKAAQFVWTPEVMFAWLENPMAMFPGSTMMSLGVPDLQQRADLIAFLMLASVREP